MESSSVGIDGEPMSSTSGLEVQLPDEIREGFEIGVDEHGMLRVAVRDLPEGVPVDFRANVQPRNGMALDQLTSATITNHRITLTDAAVVNASLATDHPLGGECWEHVIAYRTGLFGFVLFQWAIDVAAHDSFVVAAGVCLAEDSTIFEPVFRTLLEHLRITEAPPSDAGTPGG